MEENATARMMGKYGATDTSSTTSEFEKTIEQLKSNAKALQADSSEPRDTNPIESGNASRRNPDGTTDHFLNVEEDKPADASGVADRSGEVRGSIKSSSIEEDGSKTEELVGKNALILFNESEQSVEGIVRQLERFGVSVYFGRRDISIGEDWIKRERSELAIASCVLIFLGGAGWGPNHTLLANESLSLNKKIIPVLLTKFIDGPVPDVGGIFTSLRYFDLTDPSPKNIRALAAQILSLIGANRSLGQGESVGGIVRPVREAKLNEGLLKVDQYADVLADLIRTAGNDESLSMAIFAPWGRGKTFLMSLVGDRLKNDHYVTIHFSAWKYRTTTEVWSFLYETIFSEASKSGWVVPVRTGLLRHGLWPAVGLLLTVAFSLSTIAQKSYLAQFIISLFGVFGVVYLFGSMSAVWRAGRSLKSNYWDLPRHRDRLGLQFAIGDDLKSLLIGWMPSSDAWGTAWKAAFGQKPLSTVFYIMAAIAVWWTAREAAYEKASGNLPVGLSVIFLLGLVIAVVLLPLLALVNGVDSRRRAVLVVDDLDRCHPDQMLEIIECLQLFLDDEEVKRRLKIIMLVEEDILRNAIHRKYREVVKVEDANSPLGHQLIGDNLEKLFLVWLRLEPLAEDELEQVFEGVCNSLIKAKPAMGSEENQTGGSSGSQVPPDKNSHFEPPKPPAPPVKKEVKGSTDQSLTEAEKIAITSMVKEIRERSGRNSWGPRAVRSFVFRYQLARMLLERQDIKSDPMDLINALLAASRTECTGEVPVVDEKMYKVAKQVS